MEEPLAKTEHRCKPSRRAIFISIVLVSATVFLLTLSTDSVWKIVGLDTVVSELSIAVWEAAGNNGSGNSPAVSVRVSLPHRQHDWMSDGNHGNWSISNTTLDKESLQQQLPGFKDLPKFLANYKNPCWREPVEGTKDPYHHNWWVEHTLHVINLMRPVPVDCDKENKCWKTRCLPYFYIVGQPKCGTTDLYEKINAHPLVEHGVVKEPHWWTRKRLGHFPGWKSASVFAPIPFDAYVDLFDQAGYAIRQNTRTMIIGESSASTLWDNGYWQMAPENANLTEPKILNVHLIHAVQPHAKIIVILRNPTERLYSSFLYFNKGSKQSPERFHERCKTAVAVMDECVRQTGYMSCVYDRTFKMKTRIRLRIGMYYYFIRDWLDVFPRDQIHVVRLDEYSVDRIPVLNNVFKFLGVGSLPTDLASAIRDSHTSNQNSKAGHKAGTMLNETRLLLDEFYMPHNTMLADLLGDKRFLWQTPIQ